MVISVTVLGVNGALVIVKPEVIVAANCN